jgi:hypothetical protein
LALSGDDPGFALRQREKALPRAAEPLMHYLLRLELTTVPVKA